MAEFNDYPFWTARFWHGMRLGDWLHLAWQNRFRIHPTRLPMAFAITSFGLFNSSAGALQSLLHGRKIEAVQIEQPPIFIIGHWRSGTTYLHELMVCDSRLSYPTTYECFAPSHFLVSEWWAPRVFWFLAPKQRPMDNMRAGMSLPQEDEFAMVALGAPSPYLRMAFPNHPPPYMEFLDMQDVAPADLQRWKRTMQGFAKALTYHTGKQLVFKSPPHTGRVQVLSELFPGARFVHLTRHPYSLFASTMRLWEALDHVQGLQVSRGNGRREYVLSSFERMYAGFQQQRRQLAANQLCEIRYEDLAAAPLESVRRVYEQLELDDFEQARPAIEQYLSQQQDYRVNRHNELPAELREEICRRWGGYMEQYGYEAAV